MATPQNESEQVIQDYRMAYRRAKGAGAESRLKIRYENGWYRRKIKSGRERAFRKTEVLSLTAKLQSQPEYRAGSQPVRKAVKPSPAPKARKVPWAFACAMAFVVLFRIVGCDGGRNPEAGALKAGLEKIDKRVPVNAAEAKAIEKVMSAGEDERAKWIEHEDGENNPQ